MIQPLPQPRHGWRDYALLLALACCWSSTYPLTKIGLGAIPPITFISARSLTAALFLLIILRLRGVLKSGERSLFTFSGTIKRVKRKPPKTVSPVAS